MRKLQCRTQISFILCQLWIGAEEANSLQSYKKKVSQIIKHPAAGLSAHSHTETEWKPLVKFFLTLRASAFFNRFPYSLFPLHTGLSVFRWLCRWHSFFWISDFQEQKLGLITTTLCFAVGRAWRMDTARAHTSHWETAFLRHKVQAFQVILPPFLFLVFQSFFFQGCSSLHGIDAVLWCFSSLLYGRGHPRYQRRAQRRTPSSHLCWKRHLHPLRTGPPLPTAGSQRNTTSLRR